MTGSDGGMVMMGRDGGDCADADGDTICDAADQCPGSDDRMDGDGDGVPDGCDVCAGNSDALDADGDGVPDGCDECAAGDDAVDADGDGVADACDVCAAGDDALDADGDTVPDACDVCATGDDRVDTDGDGVPNACDSCVGEIDDADGDGVPDACDICEGGDDADDTDSDTVPDSCDACAGEDDRMDADGDGAPDACDVCAGSDDADDPDGDGVPTGCDLCLAGDDAIDTDADGVPDACDLCAGFDDSEDVDGDGLPDRCDTCGVGYALALGPVMYWRLGDGPGTIATDLSGQGRDGTYFGTAPNALGMSEDGDAATDFNASNARVQHAFTGGFPTNAFTVSFFARHDPASSAHVFSYAVSGRANELLIGQDSGGMFISVREGTHDFPAGRMPDDRWVHVAITRDGTGLVQLYLDGVLTSSLTATGTLNGTGTLVLGQDQDSVGGGFDSTQDFEGMLDEVAVYNRALPSADVLRLFQAANCSRTSCGAVAAEDATATDGTYWIDPDGPRMGVDPRQVYCDMTFDDGSGRGWALIGASQAMPMVISSDVGPLLPTSRGALPTAFARALAEVSSQVHIRSPGAAATDSITSEAGGLAITNLRAGAVLNLDSSMTSVSSPLAEWTGPRAMVSGLFAGCSVASKSYPTLYWACNNTAGLHLSNTESRWVFTDPNEALEVYVH